MEYLLISTFSTNSLKHNILMMGLFMFRKYDTNSFDYIVINNYNCF